VLTTGVVVVVVVVTVGAVVTGVVVPVVPVVPSMAQAVPFQYMPLTQLTVLPVALTHWTPFQ